MFDPSEFQSTGGKYLNAKWLKTLPKMACKVVITGGGSRKVPSFKDKNVLVSEAFLTVTSSTSLFEGEKDMVLTGPNMDVLLAGLGRQPDSWRGKEIGVFFDPLVKIAGEVKGAMRVKVFEADPFADAAPATPPPAPAAPAGLDADIPF